MIPAATSLTDFCGETIWSLGQLRLLVIIGDSTHSTKAWMNFMVVKSLSPYNGIIGRPGLKAIQAVPSTVHGMLKLSVEGGIVIICSTVLIPTECTSVIASPVIPREDKTHPADFKVALHPDFLDQEVVVGGTLSDKRRTELCSILKHEESLLPRLAVQPSHGEETRWQLADVRRFYGSEQGLSAGLLSPVGNRLESGVSLRLPFQVLLRRLQRLPPNTVGGSRRRKDSLSYRAGGQIGRNIEVYVDDLVVKSHTEAEMMRDVEETFRTLRKINMKLNPKKCPFGLAEGVFLGYVITPEGIKPCSDKTAAVLQLPSPRTIKETLKKCIKKSDFHWTAKAEQAFRQLKQDLSELPLLVTPKPQKELVIYLFVAYGAISAVLMTEREMVRTPVYFISRALQGPELNYSPMEKLVLSLVFAAKRLRRYFQAHPITVVTDQPIKQVLSRPGVARRLQKWSIMLREYNVTYRPRTSVKGQILADFLIEMPEEVSQAVAAGKTQEEPWTLFSDGSSCVDGSGAWLILTSPQGAEFTYALRFQFTASNNKAEYEALVAGLRIAAQMGVKNVQVRVDSKLVANQVLGTYVAKEDKMIKYLVIVKGLVSGFTTFTISQVSRSKNKKADGLSKIVSTSFAHLSKQVLVEVLENKSIKEKEVATVIEEDGPTWMTHLVDYLKEGTLPGDEKEARKLRLKARQYELLEGSFIDDRPRSVVAKATRLGYYWPTMHKDARDMIRKCSDCQVHRPVTRHPQQHLTPITAPWPFYKWGIDIAGLFPKGPEKVKILIVAMDYFTKWIEAKAVATITGGQDWCDKLNITQRFASVKHPQSNGLVERRTKAWEKELNPATGRGIGIGLKNSSIMPTYRTVTVDVVNNDEELRLNLELLEERRERAAICEAKAKSKMIKYYNARVRGVTFKPGEFVYRNNDASHAVAGGKLGPKWEGPYEVIEALGDGAYKLRSMDGTTSQERRMLQISNDVISESVSARIPAMGRTCK
uniref:Reverse transcriptase domain-containing protein n=1 Tax=Tanacetum cinerariifolium TaxID=118510 RepID=A0A6L2KHU1_TANCI|nr:reverse transcriptase domain-containing protein [Tanacetum cinerariifolium]